MTSLPGEADDFPSRWDPGDDAAVRRMDDISP
jgi:hypothetical protein